MGNVSSRVFESAGPEGKVRGTPQQIIEKYLNMARDAQTSGDRVMSENFLQHAEHYIRLLSAAQQALEERRAQGQPGGPRDGDEAGRDYDDFEGFADRFTQPERAAHSLEDRPAHQPPGAQSTDPRDRDQQRRDQQRRDQGERQRDPRDVDRPRGEGGEERSRRDRNADRPRRDDAGQRPDERRHGRAAADAFDTIDTSDDAAPGLVATPESAAAQGGAAGNGAMQDAAEMVAEPQGVAQGDAAPAKAAEKPAPRRRRRRTADAESAADQTIPDQATAD